jgi:hypothetical protein
MEMHLVSSTKYDSYNRKRKFEISFIVIKILFLALATNN